MSEAFKVIIALCFCVAALLCARLGILPTLNTVDTDIPAISSTVPADSLEAWMEDVQNVQDPIVEDHVMNAILDLEAAYCDDEGWVQPEDLDALFDSINERLDTYLSAGYITYYERQDTCFYIVFASGLSYFYTPPVEVFRLLAGSGYDMHIQIYEPFYSDDGGLLHTEILTAFKSSLFEAYQETYGYLGDLAYRIITKNSDYSLTTHLYDGDVTFEAITQWKPGSVIIWLGHGGYTDKTGPVLQTHIVSDDASKDWYRENMLALEDRYGMPLMIFSGTYICVTPAYFNYFYEENDLAGCLIYLAACDSLKDDRLASVLLAKGASVVVGATDEVEIEYTVEFVNLFFKELTRTDTTVTAQEAMDYAGHNVSIHPVSDFVYELIGKSSGDMIMRGDSSFTLNDEPAEALSLDLLWSARVVDAQTGEPIEEAQVWVADDINDFALLDYSHTVTDSNGYFTFSSDSVQNVWTVMVSADGYEGYLGEIAVTRDADGFVVIASSSSDGIAAIDVIELTPKESYDDQLQNKFDKLIADEGIIASGTEDYYSVSGSTETVVPHERLCGILFSDIYDYDGDGVDELVVLEGLGGPDELGTISKVTEVAFCLSVYDQDDDGDVMFADSVSFSMRGLTDTGWSTSIQFFRTEVAGTACLFLDYYFSMNSQSFGVLQFVYNGTQLVIKNAVECSEFYNIAICDTAHDSWVLDDLCWRQIAGDGQRWTQGTMYGGGDYGISTSDAEAYLADYASALAALGLADTNVRSMLTSNTADGVASGYDRCTRRPSAHYRTLDGAEIVELGGILSPYAQASVTLTCYGNLG